MLRLLILLPVLATASWIPLAPEAAPSDQRELRECPGPGKVYGEIQVVDNFADCKVQVVESFPDLKVHVVDNFADDPGEWEMVENFPDYSVQIVESFPDFKIQYVESFPGVNR